LFSWSKYFEIAPESQHRRPHHNGVSNPLAQSIAPQTELYRVCRRRNGVQQLEDPHIDLMSSVARSGTNTAHHLPRNSIAAALTMLELAAAKTRRLTST
jgi:hypothetical protein